MGPVSYPSVDSRFNLFSSRFAPIVPDRIWTVTGSLTRVADGGG